MQELSIRFVVTMFDAVSPNDGLTNRTLSNRRETARPEKCFSDEAPVPFESIICIVVRFAVSAFVRNHGRKSRSTFIT